MKALGVRVSKVSVIVTNLTNTGAKSHENLLGGSRAVKSRQINGQAWES